MDDPRVAESLAERRIREAMARGEFDHLPGAGSPIPGAGTADDDLWWVRNWIDRQRRNQQVLDEARRLEESLGPIWMLPTETEVREAVAELKRGREETCDVEDVLSTWRAMAGGRRRLNSR